MKYKTMLITGGAGFIGSNFAVSFKKKYPGLKIIALDNLKRRGSELNIIRLKENGVSFIHGDIRCREDLAIGTDFDILIECSAEPSVLAGLDNPDYVINTNFSGTVNCLELARKSKADIVFLSTSRVYPYDAINSIKTKELETRFDWGEDQKIEGWSKDGIDVNFRTDGAKTLYGATKLCSEIILQEYMVYYGIKGVINRCGVVAGPGQFGKIDQGIFTFWLLSHYFKKDLNYIGFGGQGKQVRDFLHIEDLFNLIDLEISNIDKISGRTYNVGGGRVANLSLQEATRICQQVTGNQVNIGKVADNRPGDIAIYISDNKRVSRDLGWYPNKTADHILSDTCNWIQTHENQLKGFLF